MLMIKVSELQKQLNDEISHMKGYKVTVDGTFHTDIKLLAERVLERNNLEGLFYYCPWRLNAEDEHGIVHSDLQCIFRLNIDLDADNRFRFQKVGTIKDLFYSVEDDVKDLSIEQALIKRSIDSKERLIAGCEQSIQEKLNEIEQTKQYIDEVQTKLETLKEQFNN